MTNLVTFSLFLRVSSEAVVFAADKRHQENNTFPSDRAYVPQLLLPMSICLFFPISHDLILETALSKRSQHHIDSAVDRDTAMGKNV